MKKSFVKYLKGAIAKNELLLTNSISDEEKKLVEDAIAELNAIVDEVENLPEDKSDEAMEALKETVANLEQSLRAMSEKFNLMKKTEEENEIMENNYLSSKQAFADFANVIRNSKNSADIKEGWSNQLIENGITITQGAESAYLPDAVKSMIADVWDREACWLNRVRFTGAKRFNLRFNSAQQDALNSRAKGWKKGGTKTAQTLTLGAKLIEGQFIYKLQEIDAQTKFDDESLVEYVLTELASQCIYEIRRAILVGDGRASNSADKVSSFESIGAKTTTDAYTTVITSTSDFVIDDIVTMVDSIVNPQNKEVTVFMSKSTFRTLSRISGGEGVTPVYASKDYVAEQIGAAHIELIDYLPNTVVAIAMILDEYYVVGLEKGNVLNPLIVKDIDIYKNLDVYRAETFAGGGASILSTAVLLPAANSSSNS